MNYKIVSAESEEVFEFIRDEDSTEESLTNHLQSDFWIDCDYLFTRERVVYFVVLHNTEKQLGYIVVMDEYDLTGHEFATLHRFADTLELAACSPYGNYRTRMEGNEEVYADGTPTEGWFDTIQRRTKENNWTVIAYRGGCGYGYDVILWEGTLDK